jgi:hypothetical protein
MSETEACSFCREVAPLRDSHVLPAFAYRWLRRRSGTGHIRHTDNPNRRVQDGPKLKWLCDDCEGLFGKFETAFATNVFHPWQEGKQRVLKPGGAGLTVVGDVAPSRSKRSIASSWFPLGLASLRSLVSWLRCLSVKNLAPAFVFGPAIMMYLLERAPLCYRESTGAN